MSGNDESLLGVTLESRLEGKKIIGESLESALLRVKNEDSGTIWYFDGLVPTCYAFQRVGLDSGWTVISAASYADVAGELTPAIVVSLIGIILSVAAFILLRRTGDQAASK